MKELIRELGRKVKDGSKTWQEATNEFNNSNGCDISAEAFRSRYRALNDEYEPTKDEKQNIEFETFTDFCNRADELLSTFKLLSTIQQFKIIEMRNYIYNEHCFSENKERDELCKNKVWEWLMSYKYEPMNKNDLFSVLGQLKKGR